ncbi:MULTISPECIES: PstS family phosphate ABC transporter substrate-binding protein [unclassified Frankia]|uniref:PstS family phosphate ABC transporter substrate-binding protein n=1 Tax=unclassified Frankia TaxID=2632575 RepID=UPI002AD3554F|nr:MULTISPECIES: substrate-binding domain-containing protein [unclassified Frankia]
MKTVPHKEWNMHIPKKAALTVAITATALAVGVMGGPALADPPAGVTPAAGDIVGVGSDTTQNIMNDYSVSYNATSPAHKLYSWNATGTTPITAKAGCANYARPNGSSAGVTALNNDPAAYNASGVCVDFARSSRYPDATKASDVDKTFLAYAKDVVTWAAKPVSPKLTPKTVSTAQLTAIYSCTLTDWHTINSALPSSPIEPYLPQSGSGTRNSFLKALSNSGNVNGPNAALVPGACVRQPATMEENSGVSLQANLQAGDTIGDALVPYSAGKWVAQSRGGDVDNRNGFTVREIDSVPATIPDVANGAAGPYSLNPSGKFARLLFNVLKNQPGSTGLDKIWSNYTPVFGKAGYICTHPLSANEGFISLPTSGTGTLCGAKFGIS